MSERMGCGVMAVMQNLNVIHGRPSFSSAFCTASVNTCGRFTPLMFKYEGEVDTMKRSCRAYAKLKSTGELCEGAIVTMQMAEDEGWLGKSGSKWKTMPELMLSYRSSTFFTRMYAPELLMGMKTEDEIIDIQPSGEPIIEKIEQISLTNGQQVETTTSTTSTTARRGRSGVNAIKKAEAVAPATTVIPPVTEVAPTTTTAPATQTVTAKEVTQAETVTTAKQPAFELSDETPPPAEQAQNTAPVAESTVVEPPAAETKRCEVVSITPRKSTTGPVLEVALKGEFEGKAYFVGTAEKFQAGVGSVGDFTLDGKPTADGKSVINFINGVTVLA
jgi:hypothetical protein